MPDIQEDKHSLRTVETLLSITTEDGAETPAKGKKKARNQETQERILDAAQHLFAIHGFAATSTKAIAEQAQIPHGLIFYYFSTKQALLETLIQERNMLPKLHAVMDIQPDSDIRSTLIHIGVRYLEVSQQYPEVPQILLREFPSHKELKRCFDAFRAEIVSLITSYLVKAIQAGELKEGKVQTIARIFVYHLIFTATIAGYPTNLQHFVEETVEVLLCTLLPT